MSPGGEPVEISQRNRGDRLKADKPRIEFGQILYLIIHK